MAKNSCLPKIKDLLNDELSRYSILSTYNTYFLNDEDRGLLHLLDEWNAYIHMVDLNILLIKNGEMEMETTCDAGIKCRKNLSTDSHLTLAEMVMVIKKYLVKLSKSHPDLYKELMTPNFKKMLMAKLRYSKKLLEEADRFLDDGFFREPERSKLIKTLTDETTFVL